MSELVITSENFEVEVLNSEIPVIVDFWADWCGPCKKLGPIIAQIAEEKQGQVKVGKVNVDDQLMLASKYKIMSIPTVILIRDGNVEKTSVGLKSKAELIEFFEL